MQRGWLICQEGGVALYINERGPRQEQIKTMAMATQRWRRTVLSEGK